jgi:hypothetical protein
MDQVKRSLQEIEEKATTRKKEFEDEYSKVMLQLSRSYVQKMKEEEKSKQDMSDECDQLEKEQDKELSEVARRIEKEHASQLKKALHEHRVVFDGLKERQRAIAHNVFQKTSKEKMRSYKNTNKVSIPSPTKQRCISKSWRMTCQC